jgi:hypothetical protein
MKIVEVQDIRYHGRLIFLNKKGAQKAPFVKKVIVNFWSSHTKKLSGTEKK